MTDDLRGKINFFDFQQASGFLKQDPWTFFLWISASIRLSKAHSLLDQDPILKKLYRALSNVVWESRQSPSPGNHHQPKTLSSSIEFCSSPSCEHSHSPLATNVDRISLQTGTIHVLLTILPQFQVRLHIRYIYTLFNTYFSSAHRILSSDIQFRVQIQYIRSLFRLILRFTRWFLPCCETASVLKSGSATS